MQLLVLCLIWVILIHTWCWKWWHLLNFTNKHSEEKSLYRGISLIVWYNSVMQWCGYMSHWVTLMLYCGWSWIWSHKVSSQKLEARGTCSEQLFSFSSFILPLFQGLRTLNMTYYLICILNWTVEYFINLFWSCEWFENV